MTDAEFAAEMMATPRAFHTPWEPTAEDWGRNRYWADFACWESWMERQIDKSPSDNDGELTRQWDNMDTPMRAVLYCAMCDLCQGATGGKE
jgi:hypothetical protein